MASLEELESKYAPTVVEQPSVDLDALAAKYAPAEQPQQPSIDLDALAKKYTSSPEPARIQPPSELQQEVIPGLYPTSKPLTAPTSGVSTSTTQPVAGIPPAMSEPTLGEGLASSAFSTMATNKGSAPLYQRNEPIPDKGIQNYVNRARTEFQQVNDNMPKPTGDPIADQKMYDKWTADVAQKERQYQRAKGAKDSATDAAISQSNAEQILRNLAPAEEFVKWADKLRRSQSNLDGKTRMYTKDMSPETIKGMTIRGQVADEEKDNTQRSGTFSAKTGFKTSEELGMLGELSTLDQMPIYGAKGLIGLAEFLATGRVVASGLKITGITDKVNKLAQFEKIGKVAPILAKTINTGLQNAITFSTVTELNKDATATAKQQLESQAGALKESAIFTYAEMLGAIPRIGVPLKMFAAFAIGFSGDKPVWQKVADGLMLMGFMGGKTDLPEVRKQNKKIMVDTAVRFGIKATDAKEMVAKVVENVKPEDVAKLQSDKGINAQTASVVKAEVAPMLSSSPELLSPSDAKKYFDDLLAKAKKGEVKESDAKAEAKAYADMVIQKAQDGLLGNQLKANIGAAGSLDKHSAELKQLSDLIETAPKSTGKPEGRKIFSLTEKVSDIKDNASSGIAGLKAVGEYAKRRLEGLPEWNGLKSAIGNRQLAMSESSANANEFAQKSIKQIPDTTLRNAISNWVDVGGDVGLLNTALAGAKPHAKVGYERALRLTPEEIVLARNVQSYFKARLQQAQDAGILQEGIENYIHRTYPKDSPWKRGVISELQGGVYTGKPSLAKQRTFKYDFEAEQNGYKPEKDFVKRIVAYDLSLNKAIADRELVKSFMGEKMADGKPAVETSGIGTKVEGTDSDLLLVKPTVIGKERGVTADGRSYIPFDHPSLRKWKWVDTATDGTTTMVQGPALVHPDALKQIKAILGRSGVPGHPVFGRLLKGSSVVKQTMLDLSMFHYTQIAVHGLEHRVIRPIDKIDFEDPTQRGLISHGLIVGEARGNQAFGEGLASSSLSKYIPYFGPKFNALSDHLFSSFIPRIKMTMGMHALERNMKVYAKQLASGKITQDQILHLTANESNAAFGGLNYEMMARNKTTQDILRLSLLAPDFLEARGRFAGQAFTKFGAEQRAALAIGAVTMYVLARIGNYILNDGDYHNEVRNAFNIVYKGHSFGLRTVQGDIIHLLTAPGKFFFNRVNPLLVKPLVEAGTGRDYFGRKRGFKEQLQDVALTAVPISLKGSLSSSEQTLLESLLNSTGLTERKDLSNQEIAKRDKKAEKIPGEFIYDPSKDKHRKAKKAWNSF